MHQIIQTLFFIGFFVIAFIIALPCQRLFNISDDQDHRYKHLDGVRGLAALGVVACHVNHHLLAYFGITGIPLIGNRIGFISVQLFFALTAFLFTKKALENKLDPASFYMARVRRIVPLYLFVASMTILVCFYLSVKTSNDFSLHFKGIIDIFSYGFLGNGVLSFGSINALSFIGIAWTLSYEWKFYLVLPPLYFLYRQSTFMAITIVLSVLLLAFRDLYTLGNASWPFFIIGSLGAWLMCHYPSLQDSKIKPFLGTIPLLALLLSLITPGEFDFKHFFLAGILFLGILIAKPKILTYKPLLFLGRISYSIYLLQYLVIFTVQQFTLMHPVALLTHPIQKFISCFSIGIILIPVATLSYKLIELPGIKGTFWSQFAFIKNLVRRRHRLLTE
ncbi:acyltransferase [Legionella anisa]|uniref:Acyltransferase n=2 Tax=Legionella anisa TaxID=28082 RepID=A0AAX0WQQ2_9GAMM|nr:acyltransferase [Legionella anisa]AWN73177.1 acyltransferase [Legionella anisa]KTC69449.1 acyltransferase [Legionella anisa]MBN5934752.1 acyltransferase [Legionella anisa]MCW8424009.1 acyltransferase [Legionella anisa]MCW8447531.1 acyltransferase [Legionella anisa]